MCIIGEKSHPILCIESMGHSRCPFFWTEPTSQILPWTNPTSHILPWTNPTSHILLQNKPTSHILLQNKPTSHILLQTKPTSQILLQNKPTSHILPFTKPTSHILLQNKPTSHILLQNKPTSQILPFTKPNIKSIHPITILAYTLSFSSIPFLPFTRTTNHPPPLLSTHPTNPTLFTPCPINNQLLPRMTIQVNEQSILAALSAMQRNDTQSIQEAGSFLLSAMQDSKNLEIFFSILCQPYPPHVPHDCPFSFP